MLGKARVPAASSTASSDGSRLRRSLCVVHVHETEGKRGRVSAVVMWKRVSAKRKGKGAGRGSVVADLDLGTVGRSGCFRPRHWLR